MDYQNLTNLTIQNKYLLPLIHESRDWLTQAKQIIQLDLIGTYHQIKICKGDEWKTDFRIKYGHFNIRFCGLAF